jgi:hypothetical protein
LQEKRGLFNVGAQEFGTLREDLEALIAHAGTRTRVKSLPVGLAIGALTALDKLHLSPLGPWHYLTYHKPFYFDNQPAMDALDWRPRHGNVEILATAYDWFVAHSTQGDATKMGSFHKKSVKQGVLRLLKAIA